VNRRGFLSLLGLGTAGLVLDPERLLWVPGQKTIFLPSIGTYAPHPNIGLIVAQAWEAVVARHPRDSVFASQWLFEKLKEPTDISGGSLIMPVAYA
jgi:hypothetical protein